jgi:pilus assembly protein CpaF
MDPAERLITIEDAAELKLDHQHHVALETRPPNVEGKGQITLQALLRNALRMRPDRIIIGEVRGPEAYDLVQALNTGHDGSLSTVHANSAREALDRLESMALMAGAQVPAQLVRRQLISAIDLTIHLKRLPDGRRVIDEVALLHGDRERELLLPIYRYTNKDSFELQVDRLPDWAACWWRHRGLQVPELQREGSAA